jgi:hypothetical protein
VFSTSPTLTTPKATTTIGVGNATAAASGAGITFPATQSDSSDVNTLDDYEEGAWTPTLNGFTTSGSQTLLHNTYTKIGRMVYLTVSIGYSTSMSTVAGTSYFSNLPFTPANSWALGATATYSTGVPLNGSIFSATNGSAYLPTITAGSNIITFSFSYQA